jgi:serine/threonine protein kinase
MVAAALDEMHSGASTQVPVVHGDVKPSNVVVSSDGAAILVDLGLARLTDATGAAGRSAAYAAPELRASGALATPEADRYAFAVTVAHVLTGQTPPVDSRGWLDPQALQELLATNPMTSRRHTLASRIMDVISSPPEGRPRELRSWLDGAVESLSPVTSTGLATDAPIAEPPIAEPQPAVDVTAARPAGEQFGPYRLESLLGRGGMGEVYRAVDTNRNRVVALKRLPAALADDPVFQARFRDESALAARLNEPHIIPIHDFGEIEGRLFIDMRLVEGTDLAHLLAEQGPLTPTRAIHVIRQIAAALDSAHAAGLIHRDVKPGNVLLRTAETDTGTEFDDGQDFAYLVDFGIAQIISSTKAGLTGTGAAIGSLTYMAPERFGSTPVDHRVDIYALGCLLHEMLTGQQPFPNEDTAALIHAHLAQDPPRPSHVNPAVPAGLDAVVATAMSKDPDDRYPSATALATAARSALATATAATVTTPAVAAGVAQTPADLSHAATTLTPAVPVPAHPQPPLPPPLQRPAPVGPGPGIVIGGVRRSPRSLAAAVIALVVLAAVGIGGYLGLTASPSPGDGVLAEPVQSNGVNPFMPSVGTDVTNVVRAPEAHGTFSGGTPGLYGGTMNNAQCDRGSMIAFLQANPDKAAAWAEVENIAVGDIAGYINQLTPVILRADTTVTNHGFHGGHANPLQSVLQAGTAVLVDPYGVPRARCYCGNPLSPPNPPANAQFTGPTWPSFDQNTLVTVQPTADPIDRFAIVETSTGIVFHRHAGSAGDDDLTDLNPAPGNAPPVRRPAKPAPRRPTPAPPQCRADQHLGTSGTCENNAPKTCDRGYHLSGTECVKDSSPVPSTPIGMPGTIDGGNGDTNSTSSGHPNGVG